MDKERTGPLFNPEHWRDRAEEARAVASQMTDPRAKATMLDIAKGYDTMAEHAQARAVKAKEPI